MSARARAAMGERDRNHVDIEGWYQELYCQVIDTHALGAGFPDMLVRIPTGRGGILALVEVKTLDGVLSPSQKRFQRDFGAVEVVRTREDVQHHVDRVREQFKR